MANLSDLGNGPTSFNLDNTIALETQLGLVGIDLGGRLSASFNAAKHASTAAIAADVFGPNIANSLGLGVELAQDIASLFGRKTATTQDDQKDVVNNLIGIAVQQAFPNKHAGAYRQGAGKLAQQGLLQTDPNLSIPKTESLHGYQKAFNQYVDQMTKEAVSYLSSIGFQKSGLRSFDDGWGNTNKSRDGYGLAVGERSDFSSPNPTQSPDGWGRAVGELSDFDVDPTLGINPTEASNPSQLAESTPTTPVDGQYTHDPRGYQQTGYFRDDDAIAQAATWAPAGLFNSRFTAPMTIAPEIAAALAETAPAKTSYHEGLGSYGKLSASDAAFDDFKLMVYRAKRALAMPCAGQPRFCVCSRV